MRVIVGITGASGVVYGLRLVEVLIQKQVETYVMITQMAKEVIAYEMGWALPDDQDALKQVLVDRLGAINYFDYTNLHVPLASGSFFTDAMVILPCSMNRLSAVALGRSGDLLERAADVTIKEGRRLVLCPREMPLSTIHLQHMLNLSQMGVKILPPVPGFYHRPLQVEDIVDFVVDKVLASLGVSERLLPQWDGSKLRG